MSSLKEIELDLSTKENPDISDTKAFLHGQVFYTITQNSATIFKIDYKLNLQGGMNQLVATSYYDKDQQKMTKWIE